MGKNVLRIAVAMALLFYAADKLYAAEHKYIGLSKCKMCHMSESKGNQYKAWSETKHAKAYQNLALEAAKETAAKVGLKTDPQKSAECLRCHVTAFSEREDLKTEALNIADGVQCESCHGAGDDYKSLAVMKDKQQAIAAGLIAPTKEVCVQCHNTESPNFKGFDFDEYYKKITHPRPKA